MSRAQRWLRHPQSVWARKALFQVHLWTGVALALYILVMSLSGTVLIYRREIAKAYSGEPRVLAGPGPRMTADELRQAAQRAHPGYEARQVFEARKPDQAAEVWLSRGHQNMQRLLNPYSGEDLGNSLQAGFRFILWLADLHDNLLFGRAGRLTNGVGSVLVTLLCISGIVIWWPGIDAWRRSLIIDWKANPRRLNWTLHSAFGFWSIAFVTMWGISGIYLSYPSPFNDLVDFISGPEPAKKIRFGDSFLAWLARMHFGRFPSLPLKIVWTIFGLVPVVLLITGSLMWWSRVLAPWYRRRLAEQRHVQEHRLPHTAGATAVYNSRRTSPS